MTWSIDTWSDAINFLEAFLCGLIRTSSWKRAKKNAEKMSYLVACEYENIPIRYVSEIFAGHLK